MSHTQGKWEVTYRIEVIELHEVEKTYFVQAENKTQARSMAKMGDWYDSYADEPTGNITKRTIKSIEEEE